MPKTEFESLKIRRITEIIESRISSMIMNSTIKAGEKLPTEKELSEKFDVSIVTVREALRGLEVAGMIEKKRGRWGGIYVRDISSESVTKAALTFLARSHFSTEHLVQVRLLIEPPMVKIVATQITPSDLKTLEDNISYCERKLGKVNEAHKLEVYRDIGEYHHISERSREFHKLLAKVTRNPVLMLTTDYLLDFIGDPRQEIPAPNDVFFTKLTHEHRGIYEALKEGNADLAESIMLSHLNNFEKFLMDYNTGILERTDITH